MPARPCNTGSGSETTRLALGGWLQAVLLAVLRTVGGFISFATAGLADGKTDLAEPEGGAALTGLADDLTA